MVRWRNFSIIVVLFHPRQFSFCKTTEFPFIKTDSQIWLKQSITLNFQMVKYSCKSDFTLTYRAIIEKKDA